MKDQIISAVVGEMWEFAMRWAIAGFLAGLTVASALWYFR